MHSTITAKEKEKSQPKPATVEVFLLPSHKSTVLTGTLRQSFKRNGRCMKITIHHQMGAHEVRNCIIRTFHKIRGSCDYTVMKCERNKLKQSIAQDLTGASAIDRRGALYLHEGTAKGEVRSLYLLAI